MRLLLIGELLCGFFACKTCVLLVGAAVAILQVWKSCRLLELHLQREIAWAQHGRPRTALKVRAVGRRNEYKHPIAKGAPCFDGKIFSIDLPPSIICTLFEFYLGFDIPRIRGAI